MKPSGLTQPNYLSGTVYLLRTRVWTWGARPLPSGFTPTSQCSLCQTILTPMLCPEPAGPASPLSRDDPVPSSTADAPGTCSCRSAWVAGDQRWAPTTPHFPALHLPDPMLLFGTNKVQITRLQPSAQANRGLSLLINHWWGA